MGGAAQRAGGAGRSRPAHPRRAPAATARIPTPVIPAPSLSSFPRSPPSFLRRQEPRRNSKPPSQSLPPSPIHPSPLLGVSCKMPNFGGPADQALSGRHPHACVGSAILQETPFRGEVRWGVRRSERPPATVLAPNHPRRAATATARLSATVIPTPSHRHSCALPLVIPAPPLPSFLRRQEPRRNSKPPTQSLFPLPQFIPPPF